MFEITGNWVGDILLNFMGAWFLLDFIVWISGGETFSRYLIKKTRRNRFAALLILLMIVLFASWFIVHLELHESVLGR